MKAKPNAAPVFLETGEEAVESEQQIIRANEQYAAAAGDPISRCGYFDSAQEFLEAANGGDYAARYVLGTLYLRGNCGMEKNHIRAVMWFGKAEGNPYADYELANMNYHGTGIDKDRDTAAELYKQALKGFLEMEKETPCAETEKRLSILYEQGLGTAKSPESARYWKDMSVNCHADQEAEEVVPIMQRRETPAGPLDENGAPPIALQPKRRLELVRDTSPEPDPVSIPAPASTQTVSPYSGIEKQPLPSKLRTRVQYHRANHPPTTPPKEAAPDQTSFERKEKEEASPPVEKGGKDMQESKKTAEKKRWNRTEKPPKKSKKAITPQVESRDVLQEFLDMITPSVMDFSKIDHYVIGNTYRCVWAIREYSAITQDLALLREFGETDGITLHIFVDPISREEEAKIFGQAERKSKNMLLNAHHMLTAEQEKGNLEDMKEIVRIVQREKERLVHCAVFIEMAAYSFEDLNALKERARSFCSNRFIRDELHLQQKKGFLSVMPTGGNQFRSQFSRVLPAASVANLYPLSYSGKTDPHGMYIGTDTHGTNIMPDFDLRTPDKTNANIVILGNSGQGKSHLLKLLVTIFRQLQKRVYCLDPEDEYGELTVNLGGCNLDMMSGQFIINVLEPRLITTEPLDESSPEDARQELPAPYYKKTQLSQHIAYLRDFFGSYKPFSMEQLDTLEIMLSKLYSQFRITDRTDFSQLTEEDYPILSDLFTLLQGELSAYDEHGGQLYTKDTLRSLTLGLQSICAGTDSQFFNGHTNITNADHINFVVKGILGTNESLKNAMFLNIFSFLNHKFLTEGKAVASLDELYLFFSNPIAIQYVLSFQKRGRKKGSNILLASQNVEDFNRREIREFTKPLLSIPSHTFIFHLGTNIVEEEMKQFLNLEESEFALIRRPQQGYCLYKSGNESYHMHVECPEYKRCLFGTAGGK